LFSILTANWYTNQQPHSESNKQPHLQIPHKIQLPPAQIHRLHRFQPTIQLHNLLRQNFFTKHADWILYRRTRRMFAYKYGAVSFCCLSHCNFQVDNCTGKKNNQCSLPECEWSGGNCVPASITPNPTNAPVTSAPTVSPTHQPMDSQVTDAPTKTPSDVQTSQPSTGNVVVAVLLLCRKLLQYFFHNLFIWWKMSLTSIASL
jgi:hypothetical protein